MGGTESRPEQEEWHRYDSDQISRLEFGDRIQFDRGTYSHWALYIEDGFVLHLNPRDSGEKVGPLNGNKWFDGNVTKDRLVDVAGTDRIKVFRDGGPTGESRPITDIRMLIDINLNEPALFFYCLFQFNCEHFVNFVKFGKPVSSQVMGLDVFRLYRPSLFGTSNPMGEIIPELLMASRNKLKTRPQSTDHLSRRQELRDICVNVAWEVRHMDRTEIEKLLFC